MRARTLLLLLLFLLLARSMRAQDVRIVVLGIFHPRHLTLSCTGGEALVVATADETIFLQPRSSRESLQIRTGGDTLLLSVNGREIHANEIQATSRNNGAARFGLGVPGKIRRQYLGTLDVKAIHGELVPAVTLDLETAVASVVQAESSPGAPLEVLKAQAVVTRSYFVAGGGRHTDFDFCDLTHCQFLREPPPPESPAAVTAGSDKRFDHQLRRQTRRRNVYPQLQRGHPHACRHRHPYQRLFLFFGGLRFLLQKSGTLDAQRISARCRAS